MNKPNCLDYGLIAWLENTRISLPLKGVEATFDVRGDLASVELCQIYHQNCATAVDVLYTFPLPDGAAVYRCEMVVNDRIISAKVMELEAARALVTEKKAAGHRVAIVESVRPNLFELALGNLAPGDTVLIRLAWFQSLDTVGSDRSFRIPLTPGVRYIPGVPLLRKNSGHGTESDTNQVPDASRLTPPRIDAFHTDAAWVSIEGRVQLEGIDGARIASPSHTLVLREADGASAIRLGDTASIPDRDFVLRIPAASSQVLTPVAWVTTEENIQHALVRIVAPATAPVTQVGRDVYFLIDRSGSMLGQKWISTCQAFRAFLGNLAPQDRAWVTFFENGHRDLANKPLPPAAILQEAIVKKLEDWQPEGGTELLPAFNHVIEALQKNSAERNPLIVLITDGQVGNEPEILARAAQVPGLRVFCYGIDTAVNDAFLRRLAAKQRGTCFLASPNDNIVGSIASLAARIRRPVLTHLQPPAGWELPAGLIPDLHAGECLSVSLRRETGSDVGHLDFAAVAGNGEPTSVHCPVRPVTDPALRCLWAQLRIESLLESGDRKGAIQLSERTNIVCSATAFVAWDETERIAVHGPNMQIYQSALEPADLSLGTMFVGARDLGNSAPLRRRREPFLRSYHAAPSEATEVPDATKEAGSAPPPLLKRLAKKIADKLGAQNGTPDPARDEPEALIRGLTSPWRQKLSEVDRIRIPGSLLDWLEHWSLADPAKLRERESLLEKLAAQLASHRNPVELLCTWIRKHLEPAFREPALREASKAFGAEALDSTAGLKGATG